MVSIQCLETAGIYTAQYIPRADYSAPRRTDYSRATRQYQFGTARPRYAVYTPFIVVWHRTPSSTISNLNKKRSTFITGG